jgi:hypothetical protein
VVWAVGKDLDGFYGFVPVVWGPLAVSVVVDEGGADEGLTDICDALVTKVVSEV